MSVASSMMMLVTVVAIIRALPLRRPQGAAVRARVAGGIVRRKGPAQTAVRAALFPGPRPLHPEAIFAAGRELPGEARFAFERPVEVEEPTGPDAMIVFEIADREPISRVRPEDARPAGAPFRFEVEMRRAKIFGAEGGLKL